MNPLGNFHDLPADAILRPIGHDHLERPETSSNDTLIKQNLLSMADLPQNFQANDLHSLPS